MNVQSSSDKELNAKNTEDLEKPHTDAVAQRQVVLSELTPERTAGGDPYLHKGKPSKQQFKLNVSRLSLSSVTRALGFKLPRSPRSLRIMLLIRTGRWLGVSW